MEIDCLNLFEVLEEYSKNINRALLILIPSWNKATDSVKQEIIDFYKDKIPEEFLYSLSSGKMRIVKYDNFDAALLDATAYFPYVKEVDEKYRINCYIIDEQGKTCWNNDLE